MKLNIFIKSFNRAYYLDRCIQSVILNVFNGDYIITVLDDGTQSRYLDKIRKRHTNSIKFIKSEYYDEKVKKINDFLDSNIPIVNMQIPASFWKKSIVSSADEYILVLEDDFWFTEPIDLAEIFSVITQYKMPFLKLFFFNNSKFLCGRLESISEHINSLRPKFKISSPFIVKNVIINNNYKSFSILQRLGVMKSDIKFDYYTLYSVAGAIYQKGYYNSLWNNAEDFVNEELQLSNAYDYYCRHKKSLVIGSFKKDVVNTSFTSSATNMFEGIDLNVYHYNHELNEAWYNESFDPMIGYPKDIDDSEIISVLKQSPRVKIDEWQKWKNVFLKQYTDIGISNG